MVDAIGGALWCSYAMTEDDAKLFAEVAADTILALEKEAQEESHLARHARYELERAGFFDEDSDYGGAIGQAVMELVYVFSEQGHSGFSAPYVLDLFTKVASYKTITDITSDASEWSEVSENLWQNKRRSSSFSHDGGKTWYDIDDASLNNGAVWKDARKY